MAGFLTGGALGRKAHAYTSALLMILYPHLMVILSAKWGFTAVPFAVSLTIALIGGIPPLRHLRYRRPSGPAIPASQGLPQEGPGRKRKDPPVGKGSLP
jgi:hypothetical protein